VLQDKQFIKKEKDYRDIRTGQAGHSYFANVAFALEWLFDKGEI
jgi:hypothetical protein